MKMKIGHMEFRHKSHNIITLKVIFIINFRRVYIFLV